MVWAVGLLVAYLAVITYIAASAAERMERMSASLDALNAEIQRTGQIFTALIAAQQNVVPAADVQAAADALKAANDTAAAAVPPVP